MVNIPLSDTLDVQAYTGEEPQAPVVPTNEPTTPRTSNFVSTAESPEPTFGSLVSDSFAHDTIQGWMFKEWGGSLPEPDPDFGLTKDLLKELGEGIPQEHWENFYDAESREHAYLIRENILNRMKYEEDLAKAPWTTSVPAVLTSGVMDMPANLAAAATGAGVAKLWQPVSRLKTIARAGLVGGAETAAIEGFLASQDTFRDSSDVALAATIGTVFGAAGGTLASRATPEEQKLMESVVRKSEKQVYLNDLKYNNLPMTEKGQKFFAEVSDYGDVPDLDVLTDETVTRTAFTNKGVYKRVDMAGILKGHDAPEIRAIGEFFEDSVGNKNHAVTKPTISLTASDIFDRHMYGMYNTTNAEYSSWAKEQGVNWVQRGSGKAREDLMTEASMVARGIQDVNTSPQARKIANTFREQVDHLYQLAQEAGVKGFDGAKRDSYAPRMWRPDRITEMVNTHGEKEVIETLAEALEAGSTLTKKEAMKVMKSSFKKIHGRSFGNEMAIGRLFDKSNRDILEELLDESNLDGDEVKSILNKLDEKPDGKIPRAKQRMDIDEGYTSPRSGLRVTDMLENDLEKLYGTYVRQLSGSIAMARFGFKGKNDFINWTEKVFDKVKSEGRATETQIKRYQAYVKLLNNHVLGKPVEELNNAWTQGLSAVRDFNFIRLGWSFTMASLPEVGELFGHFGLRTMRRHIPVFNRLLKQVETGDVPDTTLQEIASWGIGADHAIMDSFKRYDVVDDIIPERDDLKVLNKIQDKLNTGKKATAILSGLGPFTGFMQRMTAKTVVQSFTDLAHGKNARGLTKNRLALIGIDDAMKDRIINQTLKHTKTVNSGLKDIRVRQINLDQWDDVEAADAFRVGVKRLTNRLVQKQDIGETAWFQHTWWGKTMTQFRTFAIVAWGKKTLHALHMRDMQVALSAMSGMFIGGSMYSAQTYLNSLTKDDPEAYRRERLKPDRLVKAAIQRSGYASIAPGIIDTFAQFVGDPVFDDYARTSELGTNFFTGNPTVALSDAVPSTTRALTQSALGNKNFTRSDGYKLKSLFPANTMPGVASVYDAFLQDLPKRE